jgi:hypothetical protein
LLANLTANKELGFGIIHLSENTMKWNCIYPLIVIFGLVSLSGVLD